jgi:hypothetical protein
MTDPELRDQIRQTFPAVRFDGRVTSCDCAECTDIERELRHRRWDEISVAYLDFTCTPTLFTPGGFQAFLPAYMLRGLDDLSEDSVVAEFTLYILCPPVPEEDDDGNLLSRDVKYLLERVSLMSPAQTQAIRAFLTFVQENACDGEKRFGRFITPGSNISGADSTAP